MCWQWTRIHLAGSIQTFCTGQVRLSTGIVLIIKEQLPLSAGSCTDPQGINCTQCLSPSRQIKYLDMREILTTDNSKKWERLLGQYTGCADRLSARGCSTRGKVLRHLDAVRKQSSKWANKLRHEFMSTRLSTWYNITPKKKEFSWSIKFCDFH
jgi:hypothetical protein